MIPLEQEFAERRGRGLVQLIERDVLDAWGRYAKVRENRDLYHGNATADMPLPWPGASNVHLPIMMEKVETLVPMLTAAFWGVEPVVNVERSPDEYDGDQTDEVEQFMNFGLTKDIPNLYECTETWFRDMGLDGMSTLKPYWTRELRMVSELHTLKTMIEVEQLQAEGQPAPSAREKLPLELLIAVFGDLDSATGLIDARILEGDEEGPALGSKWVVRFTEDRIIYHGIVEFIPGVHLDEIQARVRRQRLIKDRPQVDVLEYEDIIVPFRTKDLQTADRVTQRYWLTVDEVEEKFEKGEWDMTEADMDTLRASGTREYDQSHMSSRLQEQKDTHVGEDRGYKSDKRLEMPKEFKPYNKNKVMVFLVHLKDAVEVGGDRTEVIYHIPYFLEKIVRADYLDEEYPHGKRPFITAKYIPIADRWHALGLGDQLYAINLEINTIINFINNGQQLVTNPCGFFEPTAMNTDSQTTLQLAPGQMIPVTSVQGILFFQMPQQPLTNMEIMTSLLMFADRLTITPLNAGSTQMKNAPNTARGTMAMLGESHVKTDMLITRLQRGPWMELMEQLFGLYQEFCPDEKWYYVTRNATRERQRISRTMLRGRYEFSFKGNTVNTNKQFMQTMAQVRLNTGMSLPDASTDPKVRENLWRDFLKHWGDGADITRLIPAAPGTESFQHPPMRQRDENKIMEQGVYLTALPTDDHAEHLREMDVFESSEQFAVMGEAYVGIYAAHKQQHMELLRQQMQTMQQGAAAPGMGNNVPQGMTLDQSGPESDLNVMEGGNLR
jgi:hypothetical protein